MNRTDMIFDLSSICPILKWMQLLFNLIHHALHPYLLYISMSFHSYIRLLPPQPLFYSLQQKSLVI